MNEKTAFNIYLILYIIVALFIVLRYTYILSGDGEGITAFFFFVGATSIFVVYGLRWFGGNASLLSNTPVSWPAVMNTCPDYLTYYSLTSGGKKYDMCIDLIGVSRNGGITKFPTGDTPPGPDATCYFPLNTDNSDPEKKRAELCQRTMAMGLTWEGISNGESCITPDGLPSGTTPSVPAGCPSN
jgi:hypothetical protein